MTNPTRRKSASYRPICWKYPPTYIIRKYKFYFKILNPCIECIFNTNIHFRSKTHSQTSSSQEVSSNEETDAITGHKKVIYYTFNLI